MESSNRSNRRGFTLVELLVVLGIVALLVALLMPALGKARKHAQEVQCAASLRSIGQAVTAYTGQYGCYPGCFIFDGPVYAVWPVRLRPFLGGEQGVFRCPARDAPFEWPKVAPEPGRPGRAGPLHVAFGYELGEPLLTFQTRRFSYGYNAWGTNSSMLARGLGWQVNNTGGKEHVIDSGWWREPRVARVKSASQMICIADSAGDGEYDFLIQPVNLPRSSIPGSVHRGGANVLFCDGHVQWHPLKDLLISQPEFRPEEAHIRRLWNSDHEP